MGTFTVALEVDAEAVEEVQRRLEPRAVLIDGGSRRGCFCSGWDRGAEGIWWVGGPSSGVEGAGWAASGGGASAAGGERRRGLAGAAGVEAAAARGKLEE
jgi:hypothetical protein